MKKIQDTNRKKALGAMFRNAGASGNKVHVMSRRGQWAVFKEGASRVISIYDTKRTAVIQGQKIAKSNSADSLIIHKVDGTVARRVKLAE